jgi:hypothetical protein
MARMNDAGFALTHLYGLTETYGPATLNEWHGAWNDLPKHEKDALRLRQGVRYPALEGLTVMDPTTMTQVPTDGETIGEVMFRGNIVMKGYLRNPEATAEAFEGGWFHSGDLAVLHPDGYIQIKDRSKDVIISGGENISSIEVEDVLYTHPSVALCAVVAKPDEKWGETPCAFIELKPDASVTAEDIIAWCRDRLDRVLSYPDGKVQGAARRGIRRAAEDLDRQDPEIQTAGIGQAGLMAHSAGLANDARAMPTAEWHIAARAERTARIRSNFWMLYSGYAARFATAAVFDRRDRSCAKVVSVVCGFPVGKFRL